MKELFSIAAGLLYVTGFLPYIRAILKGETKPAKATWLIWASLDLITMASMYSKNALNGLIVGATVGACIVALLSLKNGTPGWTKLDKFCLVGAVLGIILWQVFNSPLLGMLVSLGVMFLGSFPTFLSAWEDPGREDKMAWTIFWLSCVCALIAIPHWTLADAAQPIMFFTIESVVVSIIFFHKT